MPDPHDTLAIFAEISIALAGFSGIVIAFGRRSAGSLSALELRRLSNLFTLSGLSLIVSLVGMALLHLNLDDHTTLWRWGSGLIFVLATPWLIRDVVAVYRLEEAEKATVSVPLVIFFDSAAAAMLALQYWNWLYLHESWPFFVALVLIITGAFQQFILLVRTGISGGSTQGG